MSMRPDTTSPAAAMTRGVSAHETTVPAKVGKGAAERAWASVEVSCRTSLWQRAPYAGRGQPTTWRGGSPTEPPGSTAWCGCTRNDHVWTPSSRRTLGPLHASVKLTISRPGPSAYERRAGRGYPGCGGGRRAQHHTSLLLRSRRELGGKCSPCRRCRHRADRGLVCGADRRGLKYRGETVRRRKEGDLQRPGAPSRARRRSLLSGPSSRRAGLSP